MGKNSAEVRLDEKLIRIYNEHGVKVFLDVCSSMLSIKDSHDWEKKKKINGEVCEVVLRVLTLHYLKARGLKGEVFQSVVLRDSSDRTSDFRTELDFILMTPGLCLTGECKSFVGDIIIDGDCRLNRGTLVADVAKQSLLHGKYLRKYLENYTLQGLGLATPPMELFCFLYSKGTVLDKRSNKDAIPVLLTNTLYAYYDDLLKRNSREVYDYDKACKQFKQFQNSEALHREHRAFVGY